MRQRSLGEVSKSSEDDIWQQHYKHYDFFQNSLPWYQQTIDFHINNVAQCLSVLDTGAGSGNLTIRLAENIKDVVAIDNESCALELLNDKARKLKSKIKLVLADVQQMPFPHERFDGVTSMFLLPFIKSPKKYFAEVYRILRKDGILSASIRAPIQNVDDGRELKVLIEDIFYKKNILPQYEKEWNELLKTSKINAGSVDRKKLTADKLKEMLEDSGFSSIVISTDIAYLGYSYFLTAKKS